MSQTTPIENSLVLYKNQAARVEQAGEKLAIELKGGKQVKVRPKDVQLLHPGPIQNLRALSPQSGDLETAWELLAGETTTLAELADLIYGAYTPATAWATWQHISEGSYFQGTAEAVVVRTAEAVAQERAAREAKAREKQAWEDFLQRVQANQIDLETDGRYLDDVVKLALDQQPRSRVLQALGQTETPERAHTLLLKLGFWEETQNPYPERLGVTRDLPVMTLSDLPAEERLDLTHLPAFAIDDEGSQDPDDALSLEDGRLWVHVADVAALIPPDTPADREARARGANLYLPEGVVPMLPPKATQMLGLGLSDVSPALSFGLDLDCEGVVVDIDIVPSWVRVRRLTYDEVETRLAEAPFQMLYQLAQTCMDRRHANGAITIDLPEVKIWVVDGEVHIRSLPPLRSRDLVREAMLLCGQALAAFAKQEGIPFAFSTQPAPEDHEPLAGLAGMFAQRKLMKPSQRLSEPAPHAGLGMPLYTQATSPLRRYTDLVVHQQLRAYLRGEGLLSSQEILARIGEAEAVNGNIRRAERLSYKHWTLIYLQQHPDWQGEGVVVEKRNRRGLLLIPDLDLEVWLPLGDDLPLNSQVPLALKGINLPMLEAYFQY